MRSQHTIAADVYLPGYTLPDTVIPASSIDYPRADIYSQDFDASSGGWSAVSGSTVTRVPLGSGYGLLVKAASGTASAKRTLSGFIVGHTYEISATAIAEGATVLVGPGIEGADGHHGDDAHVDSSAVQYAGFGNYTATATTLELRVVVVTSGGQGAIFDEVVVTHVAQNVVTPATVVPGVTVPDGSPTHLHIVEGGVTLDESWAPFGQLKLKCWTPPAVVLGYLNPLDNLRVKITLTRTFGDTTSDWNSFGYRAPEVTTADLVLTSREVDLVTGTMELEIETDEILLQSFALLQSGNFTPRNLDPSATVEALGSATITTTPPQVWDGAVWEGRLTVGAAFNGMRRDLNTLTSQIPNGATLYGALEVGNPGVSAVTVRLDIGDVVASYSTLTLQPGERKIIRAAGSRADWAFTYRFFDIALQETGRPIVYRNFVVDTAPVSSPFVGNTVASAVSAALARIGASLAITNALADAAVAAAAMIWKPGVSGWDYVAPLVQAAGLRLYCGLDRVWRLEQSGVIVPGLVRLAVGQNVTKVSDRISTLSNAEYYTGVVVVYEWTDTANVHQIAYDTAGVSGKVLTINIDGPLPVAGAAAAVLARIKGRARVFNLEAMSDYTVRPGQTLSASLPDTPLQVGFVSAVTWRFPAARMSITHRALVEAPAHSWLGDTAGASWLSLAAGIDWSEDL